MSTLSIARILPAGRLCRSSFIVNSPTRHRLLSSAISKQTSIYRSAYDEGGPCACAHCEPSNSYAVSHSSTGSKSTRLLEIDNGRINPELTLDDSWSSPNPNANAVKLDLPPTPQTPQPHFEAPNLPTVPRIVGWPTPWITQQEYDLYLVPLFKLGWDVALIGRDIKVPKKKKVESAASTDSTSQSSKDTTGKEFRALTGYLTSRFGFSKYDNAVKFMNGIVELANKEKHHPGISLNNSPAIEVVVRIQTDSAIRPLLEGESEGELITPTRKIPGITRRDARLASLIEQLYFEMYLSQGLGGNKGVKRSSHTQPSQGASSSLPSSWEELINKLCPKPKPASTDKKPSTQKRKALPQKRHHTHFTCRICKGNHMTTQCAKSKAKRPCSNCGGDHWLVDCTVPRKPLVGVVARPAVFSPPLRFDIPSASP